MSKWTSAIDQVTDSFLQEFGALSAGQLNWKPNPGIWSIAQNIDHLIVINETYFPVIQEVRKGTYRLPFTGRLGFFVSFIGKSLLNAVQPDRRKKMKTFPIWEPSASDISPDILSRFQAHQSALKRQIEDAADLIQNGTVISSPANRQVVYKLETAFDIIAAHEQRHLQQAREVLQMMGKP